MLMMMLGSVRMTMVNSWISVYILDALLLYTVLFIGGMVMAPCHPCNAFTAQPEHPPFTDRNVSTLDQSFHFMM
jgi:hypothetical protein